MKNNPYARFQEEKLILRDELAIDRTILANERTILAYFRSALTLVIVGITFLQFLDKGILPYIGMAFIPCGLIVGIWGYIRYRKMDASIRLVRKALGQVANENKNTDNQYVER